MYCVWRFYYDRDDAGQLLVDAKPPWPARLTDKPTWCEPAEAWMEVDDEVLGWNGAARVWDKHIQPEIGTKVAMAPAGAKMYVTFGVAYEYKTPGGTIEQKWDPDLQKWIPVKSSGLLGYVYSDPIAACTIEFK